jgi:hypothetical protein
MPSYDYAADDARADIADAENNARAADAHFTCGHCHQLAKFSELTQLSICCGWTRENEQIANNEEPTHMETRSYQTVDKSAWGRGPWQQEPDKVQWQDEATGLPCLIVRAWSGALCGYVGVAEGHPLFGKDYSQCVQPQNHKAHEGDEEQWHHSCTPGGILSAHGGITFADFCTPHEQEDYAKWLDLMERSKVEAAQYPRGDAARRVKEQSHLIGRYEAWREQRQASSICHIPGQGEPDRVWWFGFDCAHSGDSCPGSDGLLKYGFGGEACYRDLAYVRDQVAGLARQLKALA